MHCRSNAAVQADFNGVRLTAISRLHRVSDEDAMSRPFSGEVLSARYGDGIASQEDVFSVVEEVLPPVFEKYGVYKTASQGSVCAYSISESMDKYGHHKPDLH